MKSEEIKELSNCERKTFLRDFDCEEVKVNHHPDFPVSVYYAEMKATQLHNIRWHWHNEFELIYMKEGEINLLLGDSSLILKAGEAVLISSRLHHSLELTNRNCAVFYTLLFHSDAIFNQQQLSIDMKYLSPILSNWDFDYLLLNSTDEKGKKIIQYAKNIYSNFVNKEFGYELICKANLCLIWVEMMKMLSSQKKKNLQPRILSNDEQRIKEVVEFIEENYAEPLTLDTIASSIHISKSECCRCFQRVLHLSPFDYLLRYRIKQATKMIQQKDPLANSISNLAITVGFNNISYFNKVFKKITNMTPSEYKKKYTERS